MVKYKFGKKYLIGKTTSQILDQMMADAFVQETIHQKYMDAVAKRAYIYNFAIINTDSEQEFISSLIQYRFLIEITEKENH
tara:strand:- start:8797 stop:9039 length:243 start_codon:yes stop_codon:yes gene_type:complete